MIGFQCGTFRAVLRVFPGEKKNRPKLQPNKVRSHLQMDKFRVTVVSQKRVLQFPAAFESLSKYFSTTKGIPGHNKRWSFDHNIWNEGPCQLFKQQV